TRLFDHLVGSPEQRQRDRDAERGGGLAVDHQFDPGHLHDGQIGWLLTLENTAGIDASLKIPICKVGDVARQAAGAREFAQIMNSRELVARRERGKLVDPMKELIWTDQHGAGAALDKSTKGAI